jgi:L-threonylcarbamoyladenylate synthase
MTATRRLVLPVEYDLALTEASQALLAGEAVILPTDTVYGLMVLASDLGARELLYRLKGRDADKPCQILVSGQDMAEKIGAVFSPAARRLAQRFWPGPLTLVLPGPPGQPSLGLRAPDHPFVQALLARLGQPLAASSANPAGQPAPVEAAAADVFTGVALLVDAGPARQGQASSVLAANPDGSFTLLRPGALDREELAQVADAPLVG